MPKSAFWGTYSRVYPQPHFQKWPKLAYGDKKSPAQDERGSIQKQLKISLQTSLCPCSLQSLLQRYCLELGCSG
jgi:hypothetical protein